MLRSESPRRQQSRILRENGTGAVEGAGISQLLPFEPLAEDQAGVPSATLPL
jgi:hypothetical protein